MHHRKKSVSIVRIQLTVIILHPAVAGFPAATHDTDDPEAIGVFRRKHFQRQGDAFRVLIDNVALAGHFAGDHDSRE